MSSLETRAVVQLTVGAIGPAVVVAQYHIAVSEVWVTGLPGTAVKDAQRAPASPSFIEIAVTEPAHSIDTTTMSFETTLFENDWEQLVPEAHAFDVDWVRSGMPVLANPSRAGAAVGAPALS
jgi:hypothetical protein